MLHPFSQPSSLICCQLRALPLGPSCCCDFVQISRELKVQRLEDSAGSDPEAPTLEISLDLMHKSPHTFWLLLHRTLPQTSAQRASSPRKSSLTTCPHGLTWAVVSRPHPSKGHSKGSYSLVEYSVYHACLFLLATRCAQQAGTLLVALLDLS